MTDADTTIRLDMWTEPGWAEIKATSERLARRRTVKAGGGIVIEWHERRAGEMNQIPLLIREVLTPREWGRR